MQSKEKLFRDPIHNVIHFDPRQLPGKLLLELIDTATFQRLRNIKQMGLANYVYHGAEHSRFSHSLGTMHVAKRFYKAALKNTEKQCEDEYTILMAAALLHDIGHAPFSHAFESALKDITDFKHEKLSVRLITDHNSEIYKIIAKYDPTWPRKIADAIAPSENHEWFHPIITSQLDADRMDYLLRDGYMTGIQNYHYDLERIIEMIDRDEQGPLVHYRALQAVESYILSRFHMYLQVYHHKTVRSAEKLIEALFRRAANLFLNGNKKILKVGRLGTFLEDLLSKNTIDINNYAKLIDAHGWTAIDLWQQSDDPVIAELAQRLLSRNYLKSLPVNAETLPLFNRIKPEIEELFDENNIDHNYFLSLDTTINNAFAPYKPNYPSLPFTKNENITKIADNIRIVMPNAKILNIEEASPIVEMLTRISSHSVRCFFPEQLRPQIKTILQKYKIIES